jgi:hypothetical protein
MGACTGTCTGTGTGLPISQIIVEIEIEIEIEIGIDACPVWHLALTDRSSFAAELCQHPNSVTRFLMSESHSIPRPILLRH